MTKALDLDLRKLKARAFDRAEWAEDALRRYHAVILILDDAVAQLLRRLPAPHLMVASATRTAPVSDAAVAIKSVEAITDKVFESPSHSRLPVTIEMR
jgi:hypothetical protein